MKNIVDVNFDFTSDCKNYWDNFWEDNILGGGRCDPDAKSKTLQLFHQILWGKQLPNGEMMQLEFGKQSDYLIWKKTRFGSDSILASFRYKKYRHMLEKVAKVIPNYHEFIEDFIHKSYTIGGSIIFPKENSINRARGINRSICDRWDLTMECIRRYYSNQSSPLVDELNKNKAFFDLFVDFKGYVNFFFLQDCVSDDYSKILFWNGDGDFSRDPLPNTPKEYLEFIEKELEFLNKRNARIAKYISEEKN